MKISIIVPIYNIEKYLNQCLNSIIDQTHKELEIILINDGSKDSSLEICKKFQMMDNRIIIINKENGGLSTARNAGIEVATGDYIIFMDSDDYWDDTKGLEKLIQSLNDNPVDLLNFHFKKLDESSNSVFLSFKNINEDEFYSLNNKTEQIEWLISNSQYISSACNKLIKRELVQRFENGVLSEDIEWSYKLLISAKSMGVCNLNFYVYRQREGSITHSIGEKHINDLISIVYKIIELSKNIKDEKFKNICNSYISFQYATILINVQYTNNETKKKYYKRLKKLSYLLKYDLDSKVHKLNKINKYFGFNLLYLFCGIYAKARQ